MGHEDDSDTVCNWGTWDNPKKIGKGIGKIGYKRISGDDSVIEMSQNSGKRPGDLRRFAATQTPVKDGSVGRSCRIRQEVRHPNECPAYDTKQSDYEVPVMSRLWGMWSTPSLPSLAGQLWSEVVAPDRVLSMGQRELKCVLMINWIAWNRTVLHLNYVIMLNWIV